MALLIKQALTHVTAGRFAAGHFAAGRPFMSKAPTVRSYKDFITRRPKYGVEQWTNSYWPMVFGSQDYISVPDSARPCSVEMPDGRVQRFVKPIPFEIKKKKEKRVLYKSDFKFWKLIMITTIINANFAMMTMF